MDSRTTPKKIKREVIKNRQREKKRETYSARRGDGISHCKVFQATARERERAMENDRKDDRKDDARMHG